MRKACLEWLDGKVPPENSAAKEARKGESLRKTPRLSFMDTCGITV